MKYSVILCTRNRPRELELCITSLLPQTTPPDEVLIIDSSDTEKDEVRRIAEDKKFKALDIKYRHTAPGLTRQRNIGIQMAMGDILFFFDDDVELEKDYMEKIVEVYQDKSLNNVGGVQGRDLNIKNSFLAGKRRLWFYRLFFIRRNDAFAKLLPSGNAVHLDVAAPEIRNASRPIRIYVMSGCMMSFHRKVFNHNLFDERYEGYSLGEDVNFSFGIFPEYTMYATPKAKLRHNEFADKRKRNTSAEFAFLKIKSQVDLFRRHLRHNPLNYLALYWSWLGILLWDCIIHPDRNSMIGDVRGIKREFFNVFKPVRSN